MRGRCRASRAPRPRPPCATPRCTAARPPTAVFRAACSGSWRTARRAHRTVTHVVGDGRRRRGAAAPGRRSRRGARAGCHPRSRSRNPPRPRVERTAVHVGSGRGVDAVALGRGHEGRRLRRDDLRRARPGGLRAALPRRGRHQPRAGRVRGARGQRARAVRGARGPHRGGQARRRDRARRRRARGRATSSARCRSRSAPSFPVGFRAAEPSRVMRVEPHDYHAVASVAPDVGKEVGRLAGHRIGGARGLQGLAAEPPPPRAIVVGHRSDAACAELCATSSTATRSRSRGSRPTRRTRPSSGAARCPPRTTARSIRVVDGKTVVRPQLRRVAELLGLGTEPARAEYDTVIVGAGPAGLAAGGVRRLGGTAHDRGRARGARRPGRHVVADRELPRLPVGRVGRRAREPRARSRRAGSAPRSSSRATIARIDAATRQVHLDGGDVLRAQHDHPRLRRRVAAARDRGLRPARRQGRLLRRRAQRGAEHARPRRPHRRRRQLGRARPRCSSPPTRGA